MRFEAYPPSKKYRDEGYPVALKTEVLIEPEGWQRLREMVAAPTPGERFKVRCSGGRLYLYFRSRDEAMIFKLSWVSPPLP